MKLFKFLFGTLAFSIASCGGSNTNVGKDLPKEGETLYSLYSEDDNASDCNLSGVYRGSMPAADCPGIEVKLTLGKDGKYECINNYIERGKYVDKGAYTLDGDVLMMVAENMKDSSFYKVKEHDLVMLDRNRQEIDSPFAHMYVLHKLDFSYHVQTGDIVFDVEALGDSLCVYTEGLTESNSAFPSDMVGYTPVGADISDLNGDGWPELLVFLTSDGSGSYGRLLGYSVNSGKSMSQIAWKEVADSPEISEGYMGHDVMSVENGQFVNSFPIYKDGDPNAAPSGGTRKVTYKLVDGEACRSLVIDRVEDLK